MSKKEKKNKKETIKNKDYVQKSSNPDGDNPNPPKDKDKRPY